MLNKPFNSLVDKSTLLSRSALFLIFFWFGVLKLFNLSPADELVTALHAQTLSFVPFEIFFPLLGIIEIAIGVLWLWPRLTKVAFVVMSLQMLATFLPLILLPELAWSGFLVPTLIGQYIIKNVALVVLSLEILSTEY